MKMLYRGVMVFAISLYIFIGLSACGILEPASDPVRQAEASRINAQSDMDVARQTTALAQANALALAQAEAIRVKAQADADIARQTAFAWSVIDGFLLAILILSCTYAFLTVYKRSHPEPEPYRDPTPNPPGLINQVNIYALREENGRWLLTDGNGNQRYLNPESMADARIISRIDGRR